MPEYKFDYDKENDDLFIHRRDSKSKGSIEFGDLVLDFNSKKQLVGIEILNASKFLKDITGRDITSLLEQLKSCSIDVKAKNNILLIKIILSTDSEEVSPIIPVPIITEPSPSLAYT